MSGSKLAPSVCKRLGQEEPSLAQALAIDAMADPEREMPLARNRRARERFRRHEHGFKRYQLILVAVDEQDWRRRATRIARGRFTQALRANQQTGKAENRRWRPWTPEADMKRHHRALAEPDEREL